MVRVPGVRRVGDRSPSGRGLPSAVVCELHGRRAPAGLRVLGQQAGDPGVGEVVSARGPTNWADASRFTVDYVGRVCTSFASDMDPVSAACLEEYGVSEDHAPEIAAAYALGGVRAVWALLDPDSRHH